MGKKRSKIKTFERPVHFEILTTSFLTGQNLKVTRGLTPLTPHPLTVSRFNPPKGFAPHASYDPSYSYIMEYNIKNKKS